MDEITQQNAALAEEASAASVSMSDLSTNMVELLSFFKTEKKAASNRNDISNSHSASVFETPKPISSSGRQTVYRSVASDDDWQDF